MANIIPAADGKVKLEQDGRTIMDRRRSPAVEALFTEEEAMLRKFRGDYTDIEADTEPAIEPEEEEDGDRPLHN